MIKRLRSLVDGNDAVIKSGRDAMDEEQAKVVGVFQDELQKKDVEILALQERLKSLQDQFQGLLSTAKSIEQERNGILIGLKVFTETVVNTVKAQQSA